jgi:hypothetical protein
MAGMPLPTPFAYYHHHPPHSMGMAYNPRIYAFIHSNRSIQVSICSDSHADECWSFNAKYDITLESHSPFLYHTPSFRPQYESDQEYEPDAFAGGTQTSEGT